MKKERTVIAMAVVFSLFALLLFVGAVPRSERKIIIYKSGAAPEACETILKKHGAQKIHDLSIIKAQSALVPAGRVAELAKEPEVLMVEDDIMLNVQVKPVVKPGKPVGPQPDQILPWGIDRIEAELAWANTTGDPIKVAVLDTGVDAGHPDLQANLKGGTSTVTYAKSYNDDNGHGTHVAGIIAALDNTIGVIGVGPNIDLYAVKVLNRKGNGYASDIIEGLQWCVNNGMQVINMSFGTPQYSQALADAVSQVYTRNIVLVAAAGNMVGGEVVYPAKFPEVIAVTAIDGNDTFAYFSAAGQEVDLAAPGVDIYSTFKGSAYNTLSGTSMAAPHVTGAAALALDAKMTDYNGDGLITPDEIKRGLEETAIDLGPAGPDQYYGAGLVNANPASR